MVLGCNGQLNQQLMKTENMLIKKNYWSLRFKITEQYQN